MPMLDAFLEHGNLARIPCSALKSDYDPCRFSVLFLASPASSRIELNLESWRTRLSPGAAIMAIPFRFFSLVCDNLES